LFGLILLLVCASDVQAQDEVSLVGPARSIARGELLLPIEFDPALLIPLTVVPQGAVEAYDGGLTGSARGGFRVGDNSYGVTVSGPLSSVGDTWTPVEPMGLQDHTSVRLDLTNMVWYPKATAALRQAIGPEGLARLTPAQSEAARQIIASGEGVDAPWAIFFNFSYRFSRDGFVYADAPGGPTKSAFHVNDAATATLGGQFFARHGDPGYFVGVSYIYSSIFHDSAAVNGTPIGVPFKVREDTLKIEARRPLARGRFGVSPAVSYDLWTNKWTTVEAAAYAFIPPSAALTSGVRFYAAVRGGYKEGGTGAFGSVVFGTLFGRY
jgi:hypothetical protein